MHLELLLLAFALSPQETKEPNASLVELVDPFIGTGGHGHTFPGATRPFGMVQLSPDTRLTGWDGCSGYHYSDDVIFGFSHTHLSGTGVSDYGDVLFMPGVGKVQFDNGSRGEGREPDPDQGYASRFRKETEHAEPGYYAVRLDDHGIDVRLTATERTGFHSYRFPASETSHIIVDLTHRDDLIDSELRVVNLSEIEGMRRSRAWAQDQRVYFVARFSKPFRSHGLASTQGTPNPDGSSNSFGYFVFQTTEGEEIMVQVGISAVDIEGARRNLDAETLAWDFDAAREQARDAWEAALSKIVVEGGNPEHRRVFYTALYHSSIAPNLFSDVDGRVRGMDGEIHHADHNVYSVFSLWDTFRATHPLYTLIDQARTTDYMKTFLHQFRTGGKLPIWELAGNYTGCMIGYHAIPVIADAYLKGIRGYDAPALLSAMRVSAEANVLGLDAYKANGFIPADHESESVSKTLEYGYDDWCIARMAEALGETETAARYDTRAQAYRHLFDTKSGFMRPRQNGGFIDPFDPREVTFHFTEANGWQYSLFVPHDVAGLTDLLGGDAELIKKLDQQFEAESATTGRQQADITGLIGQYAHGNEPSHHVAYLYNYAGQPWKTQRRVYQILTELYHDQPDGLSGNEDCGQMSSWYVLSALGMYPVCPGSNEYVLGTPLFDRATLHFENGKSFTIEAQREAAGDFYVQGAEMEGEAYPYGYLTHETLLGGGALRLQLGSAPNKEWASAPEHRPRSDMGSSPTLAVPNISSKRRVFRDTVRVAIEHTDAAALHYTLDGTLPTTASPRYREPLTFAADTELRAIAATDDGRTSTAVTAHFKKLDRDWSIASDTPYSTQYTGGGKDALIDGLRGAGDFRVGSWQGWYGEDMQVTIDLKHSTPIHNVQVGFLQDVRSWIWAPTIVEFHTSQDGVQFELAATAKHEIGRDDYEADLVAIGADLEGRKACFVRVIARVLEVIPDWHPGRGNQAWVFADEILID